MINVLGYYFLTTFIFVLVFIVLVPRTITFCAIISQQNYSVGLFNIIIL